MSLFQTRVVTTSFSILFLSLLIQPSANAARRKAQSTATPAATTQASTATASTKIDDRASGWSFGSGWAAYSDPSAYNKTAHGGKRVGGYGQYSFNGTGITVYAWKGSDGGNLQILIDGVSKGIVSQRSATELYGQAIYTISGLASGAHVLKLVGQDTDWTMVDYVVVSTAASTPTPVPPTPVPPTPVPPTPVPPTPTPPTTGAPTADSASKPGPYSSYSSYTSGIVIPKGSDFTLPKIFYPKDGPSNSPGIVYIPGHNDSWADPTYIVTIGGKQVVEGDLNQWVSLLTSYGFTVMFVNPSNLGSGPNDREDTALQAVQALINENTRVGSPIYGKLNVNNIATMGHSYGGAGALYAANANANAAIKASIGFSPVPGSGYYPAMKAASIIIAGQSDPYFSDFIGEYNSIPSTTPKLLAQFKQSAQFDSMHSIAMVPLGTHTTDPIVARLVVSFLQVYLWKDMRYQQFLVTDPTMYKFGYNP